MNDAADRRHLASNLIEQRLGLINVADVAGADMDCRALRADVIDHRCIGLGDQPRRLMSTKWRAPARASTQATRSPSPDGTACDQVGRIGTHDVALRRANISRGIILIKTQYDLTDVLALCERSKAFDRGTDRQGAGLNGLKLASFEKIKDFTQALPCSLR